MSQSQTQAGIWEKIQTYTIVTVIAALIWLYAEDENAKDFDIEADVRFVAAEGRELLIEPTSAQNIRLTVRCNTGQFSQLQKLLTSPVELPLKDALPESPTQQVLLKEELTEHDRIARLGVSILEVQPKTVAVNVERLERVELPIIVAAGDVGIGGTPSVEPIQAAVKVPTSLAKLIDGQRLEVRLRDVPNLAGLGENVAHTVELPIQLPALLRGSNIKVEPTTAKVTFTIRAQTDTVTLTAVPVLLQVPPASFRSHVVEIDPQHQFLPDVQLSGPSDVIAAIRRNEVRINAILPLTTDDLDNAITSKLPVIDKPAGVTVVSPVLPVNFTITPRGVEAPSP